MVKTKKNKKPLSEAVYAKKNFNAQKENPFAAGTTNKNLNPFEVHVNNQKFQILGRTCKHDKGLPGVSRGKANKRRAETLGREYLERHKTNRFRDRRIGRHLTEGQLTDDVLNARFLAEKLSQLHQNKASRFNLNDDEILTHRGKTLVDIEQFQDERSDNEDLENEGLDAGFTTAAHFGGEESEEVKDRKSAIEEMILEQKRRKIEIAKEKDEVYDLTVKLDSNYKELMGLMGKMSKDELKVKQAPDDYDKIMRELVFEPRGTVTDKLLSEEELAAQEKERLERLENERLKRMLADGEDAQDKPKPKHRSADELDDGYFAYEEEDAEGTLAYHLNGELGTMHTMNKEMQNSKSDVEGEDSADESEGDDSQEENDEESSVDEGHSDNSDSGEDEDNLSDLKSSDSEEEIGEGTEEITSKKINNLKKDKLESKGSTTRKLSNLPFTIDLPENYEKFKKLLGKYTPVEQGTLVERLIKLNHPKLEGVNRDDIVKLFTFLLQYINDLFSDATPDDIKQQFLILDRLNPHLFDLVQLNPERMSQTLLNVIKEKYADYRKNPKTFPPLESIIFFKLVSNYYSSSDFRHPVVTPCYIYMQHVLSKARVHTREEISKGLFLVTVALEYAQLSKRFLPAVFNFLLGMVYLSIPKRPVEVLKIMQPFQSSGPMSKLLAIADSSELNQSEPELLQAEDLVIQTLNTSFKVRALNMSLRLIRDAITGVSDNLGANYLSVPLLGMLARLPLEVYPVYVRESHAAAVEALARVASKQLTKLVPPEKKPKALRLLEPRIETVYNDKRRPKVSKEKEEKLKLLHKVKRETKGAIREIRLDTQFLQKMRIQQQMQSDMERKEKVKRIYAEAATQQGELNELARLKKKRKF